MSKITSVEPQKSSYAKASERRGTQRFNVYIDGQFAFGADEDLVVNYRLVPGKEIEPPMFDKLLFEAEVGKLTERMYGLFSVRQRSEKEVRDYLKNLSFKRRVKGKEEISEASIELLVERLKQKGLINDLEFAKAWVEGRRRSKQKGIRALKAELFQKGIEREIIEEIFDDQFSKSDSSQASLIFNEEDLARQALEKKMKIWKKLEPQELNEKSLRDLKKKATEFLLRRGFEYEIVKVVVANIIKKK